ncbi:MAG: UDP-N-acetylglucosamine pyrophosphorylase [Calditrichaeota bacterium]|nr:MAG: UDP-N-acetylglucosamine pyrophosphorylase [Calditrichota bacterium]
MKKAAVVLAAGKGTRMKSELPKVLHPIKEKPMIQYVVETLQKLHFDKIIVVIGYKGELVKEALTDYPVEFVWQHEQNGTGHAVMMAKDALAGFDGNTLIALGDVPFLSAGTIQRLVDILEKSDAKASCLSAIVDNPNKYGRVIRDGDSDYMKEIVEDADATDEQKQINEINTGTFCFDNKILFDSLGEIDTDNAQGELYLTDCVKVMFDNKMPVTLVVAEDPDEGEGINDVEQLRKMTEKFKDRL